MLETSKDLLFIIIAVSILWLTLFLSWTIYYFAQILRQINNTLKRTTGIFEKFDTFLDYLREKLDKTSSYFTIILTGVKQLMDYVGEKKEKKRGKKIRKKKKIKN